MFYISGYAEDQIGPKARRITDDERSGFLTKPFDLEERAIAVRLLLQDGHATEADSST